MLQQHPKTLMISNESIVPATIDYDNETDTTRFYHQESGKEIDVIDYFAKRWSDDYIMSGEDLAEVVPAVLNLYDHIREQSDCQICELVDFTENEYDEHFNFIIAAVRNPEALEELCRL